jgi:hypothetical protein
LAYRTKYRTAIAAQVLQRMLSGKGADIEKVRQGLGHSRPDMTRIYQRAASEATAEIAVLRFGGKNSEQG